MSWKINFKYQDGKTDYMEIKTENLPDAEGAFDCTFPDLERIGSSEIETTITDWCDLGKLQEIEDAKKINVIGDGE